MASLLSFYSPKQSPVYFFNLEGRRKNQFDFWEKGQWSKEKVGLFVLSTEDDSIESIKKSYLKNLGVFFEEVNYVGDVSLFDSYGVSVKKSLAFRCKGFRGFYPQDVSNY